MSKTHEVMFYTDGRHSSVYLYEPPMGAKQYLEPIDELVDLGIDTHHLCRGRLQRFALRHQGGRALGAQCRSD